MFSLFFSWPIFVLFGFSLLISLVVHGTDFAGGDDKSIYGTTMVRRKEKNFNNN